jgi:hypothetical protein
VSEAVYYWVVIAILSAGFLAGMVIFFTHDCEQVVRDLTRIKEANDGM